MINDMLIERVSHVSLENHCGLNHFTSEYCLKLKRLEGSERYISISDYFVGQVEYGRKSPLDG